MSIAYGSDTNVPHNRLQTEIPFALPLSASKLWKWYVDDASGKGVVTIVGEVSKPRMTEQRDYLIVALNSYPLFSEMLGALKGIKPLLPEDVQEKVELLIDKAEAVKK